MSANLNQAVYIKPELQDAILQMISSNRTIRFVDAKWEDIDTLAEPERTKALEQWFDYPPNKGTIKLGTSDKKNMEVNYLGSGMRVQGHVGLNVDRATAAALLDRYGPNGKFRGTHQASGHTRMSWSRLSADRRAYLLAEYPDIETYFDNSRYLVTMSDPGDDTPDLNDLIEQLSLDSLREETKKVEDVY